MPENWVHWLDDLGADCNELVGKKCANLGEMAKIGLPVPCGFALSVDAYHMFLKLTGADEQISEYAGSRKPSVDDIAGISRLSQSVRQIIESKKMPAEMKSSILDYYQALCSRCGMADAAVSTRSAGTVSHPGQYETYLNVKGPADLLDKIKKVWSSTFNPRSLAFRLKKGMEIREEPIGVAVLAMVQARSAGIAFSADPNTGDLAKVIVEANWGLGESVVSGELMPDRWVLEKESLKILERTLGKKEKVIVGATRGVVEEKVPEEKSGRFCLSDDEVRKIAGFAIRLESHFGLPQDIEWAVSSDAAFPPVVLLQTRPVVIAKKSASDQIVDMMVGFLTVS